MNNGTYLLTLLCLHVMGLVLMAGTTFVDYIAFSNIWNLLDHGKEKPDSLLQVTARFSRLIGIGAAILILTGLGMMALTKGVFGEQLWFRIKFGLVIILVANGVIVGRRHGLKFRKLLTDNGFELGPQIMQSRSKLNRFYIIQLAIFITIIILSVFKFN